jgi:hypothetical protein
LVILPLDAAKTSRILPGVHTTISAPLLSSESYPVTEIPPYTATTLSPHTFPRALASL